MLHHAHPLYSCRTALLNHVFILQEWCLTHLKQDWTRLNKIEPVQSMVQSYWFTHNTNSTFNNVLCKIEQDRTRLSLFLHVLHLSFINLWYNLQYYQLYMFECLWIYVSCYIITFDINAVIKLSLSYIYRVSQKNDTLFIFITIALFGGLQMSFWYQWKRIGPN